MNKRLSLCFAVLLASWFFQTRALFGADQLDVGPGSEISHELIEPKVQHE